MNPFQSLRNYEEFIYTLKERFPSIERSTLVVVRRGKQMAIVQGEVSFAKGYRLGVRERMSFDSGGVNIEFYGYELWHYADKIAWYNAQPHPHVPALASTFPHHKHVPPDIKHNRIPAPGLRFDGPNLSLLIQEIESLL